MPRIPTALVRKAYTIDPLLPALLAPCRDLQAARNELRWLRQHVSAVAARRRVKGDRVAEDAMLKQLVRERAGGKPLQYLLGSEFFGDLEIECRRGVLVPRADTAASISHLVRVLRHAPRLPSELRVLDLCTGSGCIPLLFAHELGSARADVQLHVVGVDISDRALALAHRNLKRLRTSADYAGAKAEMSFLNADVLMDPFGPLTGGPLPLKTAMNFEALPPFWDVVISNPPYISPRAYWKTTARSVRAWEPKLALVPPPPPPPPISPLPSLPSSSVQHAGPHADDAQADVFYPHLLNIARDFEAKVLLLEVADLAQALRVARSAAASDTFERVEIWREQPDARAEEEEEEEEEKDHGIAILGQGNARSVVCWRDVGLAWLGRRDSECGKREKEADWKEYIWPR
ncbi:hypothetical protein J1614_000235 [Plenodomus biglobosus]|nr:hypothetical protein J1614_000235 [Plenodomus biglobosus]